VTVISRHAAAAAQSLVKVKMACDMRLHSIADFTVAAMESNGDPYRPYRPAPRPDHRLHDRCVAVEIAVAGNGDAPVLQEPSYTMCQAVPGSPNDIAVVICRPSICHS